MRAGEAVGKQKCFNQSINEPFSFVCLFLVFSHVFYVFTCQFHTFCIGFSSPNNTFIHWMCICCAIFPIQFLCVFCMGSTHCSTGKHKAWKSLRIHDLISIQSRITDTIGISKRMKIIRRFPQSDEMLFHEWISIGWMKLTEHNYFNRTFFFLQYRFRIWNSLYELCSKLWCVFFFGVFKWSNNNNRCSNNNKNQSINFMRIYRINMKIGVFLCVVLSPEKWVQEQNSIRRP